MCVPSGTKVLFLISLFALCCTVIELEITLQLQAYVFLLLLIKRYNLYKVLACSTGFFQLSLFCAAIFQLRTFILLISSKSHLPNVFQVFQLAFQTWVAYVLLLDIFLCLTVISNKPAYILNKQTENQVHLGLGNATRSIPSLGGQAWV